MTSLIKVDAIQKLNGSVPKASDLGLNVTGTVLQVQNFQTGSGLTTTTTIPYDDTIPQITEGGEVMTLNITPTSASSKLLITVITHLSGSVNAIFTTALFEGTTANALACSNNVFVL